eukprot:10027895-Karenia_brevis.AAC.1
MVLNGASQKLDIPPAPPSLTGEAPLEPNVYSDGAFTHPATPIWPLAFSMHKQCADGLESFLYLDGLPSSSARAELLALLGSTFIPAPVHVALDNQSVVGFASYLVQAMRESTEFCFNQFHNK